MSARPLRLLYLGFVLPPAVAARHPEHNPAGQRFEAALVAGLARYADLRVVAPLPRGEAAAAPSEAPWRDALFLPQEGGAFLATVSNLARLRRHLRALARSGWEPDAVLCYHLTPLYNAWLRVVPPGGPARFCLLADSSRLDLRLSPWKRLRYALKPFHHADRAMFPCFDGFVTLSLPLHRRLEAEGRRSLWMPGACDPAEILPVGIGERSGPPVFGYYGALGEHAGAEELVAAHAAAPGAGPLRLCGYGKRAALFRERCAAHPNQEFAGTLPTAAATLAFGHGCDVLVNPRPSSHGNENNFPSKIFSYVLSGAAILTTPSGGVDAVLGESAFYLDEADLAASLRAALVRLTACGRETLRQKAEAAREIVLRDYTWEAQAARIAAFLKAG